MKEEARGAVGLRLHPGGAIMLLPLHGGLSTGLGCVFGVWPSFSLVGFALWALFPACVLRRMEYILCVCAFSLFFHVFLICPAVNEQSPKLLKFVSYKS